MSVLYTYFKPRFLSLCIIGALYFLFNETSGLISCPILLTGSTLPSWSLTQKQSLYLYSWNGSNSKWERIAIQIDSRDMEQRLIFQDEKLNPILKANDLISFYPDGFGDKIGSKRPCEAHWLLELRSQIEGSKYLYLASCREYNERKRGAFVSYQSKRNLLASDSYLYFYDRSNHMLFDRVFVKDAGNNSLIALNSDLAIHADFKNFLSFTFDSKDIQSRLEKQKIGPIGAVASVSFYLKLLFFKIKLQLTTDVYFFKNSAYIPMLMHSPRDAARYLTHESGIIYSWQYMDHAWRLRLRMPGETSKDLDYIFSPDRSKIAFKFCNDNFCTFNLEYRNKMKMEFRMSKRLVEKGFMPFYLDDISNLNKKLNFQSKINKRRTGVFFNTQGLTAGTHKWDFWIKFGRGTNQSCPYPISLQKI